LIFEGGGQGPPTGETPVPLAPAPTPNPLRVYLRPWKSGPEVPPSTVLKRVGWGVWGEGRDFL